MNMARVFWILAGIVCLAVSVTGLLAGTTPLPLDGAPASISDRMGTQWLLLWGAGIVFIIGGTLALWLGTKKSHLIVSLVAVTLLACTVFAIFTVMTRWTPDEEWAAKLIEESVEIQSLLEEYREENDEFPLSLDGIDKDYVKPTEYRTRNSVSPNMDQWHYDRIGKDNYQLFVIASSWVSYFDAMVYRHKGEFAEPWFAALDTSHSKKFGKWRYVKGFSRFYERYTFDADGEANSISP